MGWRGLLLASLAAPQTAAAGPPMPDADPSYFEGRWATLEESCAARTNWTMIGGGTFVSEDLQGTWAWESGKLILRLDDLAIDEETGEAGGRFRMDGPVEIVNQDRFDFTIAPDVYRLKRCN
ncbi:hypothetical protein [Parasphingorhabdus sp.]|uniref:hypothetical protein n=1 Tax=Parasphingorhabdus sp. TaxID=2709688 RepID=UPI003A917F52